MKLVLHLLLIFMLICLINPLSAGEGDYISLDLRNIEVTDALKFLASKVGLDIIPTNEVSGRITLMVENVPVRDVFLNRQ